MNSLLRNVCAASYKRVLDGVVVSGRDEGDAEKNYEKTHRTISLVPLRFIC